MPLSILSMSHTPDWSCLPNWNYGPLLNEMGRSRSRNQEWGWVVHQQFLLVTWSKVRLSFPHLTPFSTLNCCSCLAKSWLGHMQLHFLLWTVMLCQAKSWLTSLFSIHPAKKICKRVFCCFLCSAGNNQKQVVYSSSGTHMIYIFSSVFVITQPFFQLQCRPTLQPYIWSWLAWYT